VQLQQGALPPKLKVGEAVELHASSFYERPVDAVLLQRLRSGAMRGSHWRTLPGGQEQRLSIVPALIGQPEAAVLDELTTGPDPEPRRETWGLIDSVRDSGVTIVLVTRFMAEAGRLGDTVALIGQGRVVALGEPSYLAADCDRHARPPAGAGTVDGSARRQTAHFEQFEPERLDLGQHAVERGLVGQRASQHGLVAVRTGLEDRERGAHRLAQAAADTDLVALGLRIPARAAGLLTAHRRTR
jgi:ABC-type multidrug transport system ATPase subunit